MHIPPHLTPAALLQKFPAVTEMLPGEVRGLVGAGETVLYFGFIGRTGGCASGQKAKQWIMITTSRVTYRATASKTEGTQTVFAETAGSILLPQISYVGSAQSAAGCGCTNTKTYNVVINSSGGSITIAMPSEAEMKRVHAFLESVLQPV